MLLSDQTGPEVEQVLRSLTAPKRVVHRVRRLVAGLRASPPKAARDVRVLRYRWGEDVEVLLRMTGALEGLGANRGWAAVQDLVTNTPAARVHAPLLDGHSIMQATGVAHGPTSGAEVVVALPASRTRRFAQGGHDEPALQAALGTTRPFVAKTLT